MCNLREKIYPGLASEKITGEIQPNHKEKTKTQFTMGEINFR